MKKLIIALSLLAALSFTSCGGQEASSEKESSQSSASEEVSEDPKESAEDPSSEGSAEHATAPQNEVGFEGMEAVTADALNMGNYYITVDSSSSMFKIADCVLHADGESLTADIIIDSKSYDALFMGTEDEAAAADQSQLITYTENESGQSVFTVPVEALDKEIQCAALSAKKQEWYDRTLVFRADSLPDTAFKEARYATAESLGLEDGEYTVQVELEGGSGKASVESPAKITVEGGRAVAQIIWSSDKYDLMVAGYLEYSPEIKDGHSVFEIPVTGFDYRMPVQAETTAMSEPHMIDYTLYFDSSTIEKCD